MRIRKCGAVIAILCFFVKTGATIVDYIILNTGLSLVFRFKRFVMFIYKNTYNFYKRFVIFITVLDIKGFFTKIVK